MCAVYSHGVYLCEQLQRWSPDLSLHTQADTLWRSAVFIECEEHATLPCLMFLMSAAGSYTRSQLEESFAGAYFCLGAKT